MKSGGTEAMMPDKPTGDELLKDVTFKSGFTGWTANEADAVTAGACDTNPARILLDVLYLTGWQPEEISLQSFDAATAACDEMAKPRPPKDSDITKRGDVCR